MQLISVIIPAFNGEKTIFYTIESIINQTYKNLEIIVVNDGSTDSTLEIVKRFSDCRLHILSYSQTGVAASRNRGLNKANGKFVSFIDADDLWTPEKLEDQFKVLQEHPQAAVAYSWTDYIDGEGKFVKSGQRVTATGDVYNQLLLGNFLENGSNPLIRREAMDTVGGFDESLAATQDWDMWLRLAACYEFVVVPKAQISYRISANSMSANFLRQEAASLQVMERAFSHEKAQSLQHLKKYTMANMYQYLTFKSLEVPLEKQQRWISIRFLWNCIMCNPSLLRHKKIFAIAVLKILVPRLYNHIKQLL
ncbi:MAG: glycosyltransferase [Scytonema sp. PMC 1069.18]|nr:glycosyltransferase [Scytonema sp. PMC 1069.18]MEC4887143.1 glycosyltransferase [Scytonema sp. PMC 1070.18]